MNVPALQQLQFGEVQLWYAEGTLLNDATAKRKFISLLSVAELRRYGRYRYRENQDEYLLGRAMVRLILAHTAGVPPSELQLSATMSGKPEIVAPAGARMLRFNISHSCGMVVVVFALDREVGVDVEDFRRRVPDDVVNYSMTASEIGELAKLHPDQRQKAFITRWSLKEAYTKARGQGLLIPFSSLAFDHGNGALLPIQFDQVITNESCWRFFLFQLLGRYSCAVAVELRDRDSPCLLIKNLTLGGAASLMSVWS
jgi:4'-phosphopantetheinyl transferase